MILFAPPRVLGLEGNTQPCLAFYRASEPKLSLSCSQIQCCYPLSHLSRPLFLASGFPRGALCSVPQPSWDLRGLWMSSSISIASQGAVLQRLRSSGPEHVQTRVGGSGLKASHTVISTDRCNNLWRRGRTCCHLRVGTGPGACGMNSTRMIAILSEL